MYPKDPKKALNPSPRAKKEKPAMLAALAVGRSVLHTKAHEITAIPYTIPITSRTPKS
jgi:hypothetical protein